MLRRGWVEKGGGASVWRVVPTSLLHDPGMAPLSTPGGRPKTCIPEAAGRLNKCSVQHGATPDQGLAHGVV